jgi:hypothetical protein
MSALAVIDHLVYFVPDLDAGRDRFERETGVRPAIGGQHVGFGTHNALVSFGECYLELIAPDPAQPDPAQPRPFGIDDREVSELVTFAVRPGAGHTMAHLVDAAIGAGHDPGEAVEMTRLRPDGVELRWSLTFPSANGLIPFFIDWGDTPNPAATAPSGPALSRLTGSTEHSEHVNAVLDALGLAPFSTPADSRGARFHAELANGVEL